MRKPFTPTPVQRHQRRFALICFFLAAAAFAYMAWQLEGMTHGRMTLSITQTIGLVGLVAALVGGGCWLFDRATRPAPVEAEEEKQYAHA